MRNNTQSGVALIALLAIFMLSATGILLYRLNNRTDFMLENQAQTAQALAKAKEALIGHAATMQKRILDNRKVICLAQIIMVMVVRVPVVQQVIA